MWSIARQRWNLWKALQPVNSYALRRLLDDENAELRLFSGVHDIPFTTLWSFCLVGCKNRGRVMSPL
jgi:hypothetical protein